MKIKDIMKNKEKKKSENCIQNWKMKMRNIKKIDQKMKIAKSIMNSKFLYESCWFCFIQVATKWHITFISA